LTVPTWTTNPDATSVYNILLPSAKIKAGHFMLLPLPTTGLSALADTAEVQIQKWACEA
jgi:hypothetical protein